jgi:hypothetical protein
MVSGPSRNFRLFVAPSTCRPISNLNALRLPSQRGRSLYDKPLSREALLGSSRSVAAFRQFRSSSCAVRVAPALRHRRQNEAYRCWLARASRPAQRQRDSHRRRARLRSDTERSREDGGLEEHAPMIVDVILKPGVALGVRARLALQNDRVAARHDDPCPDQQHTALPKSDGGVVLARSASHPAGSAGT